LSFLTARDIIGTASAYANWRATRQRFFKCIVGATDKGHAHTLVASVGPRSGPRSSRC